MRTQKFFNPRKGKSRARFYEKQCLLQSCKLTDTITSIKNTRDMPLINSLLFLGKVDRLTVEWHRTKETPYYNTIAIPPITLVNLSTC